MVPRNAEDQVPVLDMPLEQARKELNERAMLGRRLMLDLQNLQDANKRSVAAQRSTNWHTYNRSWFERYLGKQLADEYDPPRIVRSAVFSPDVPTEPAATASNLKLTIDRVNRIESIKDRLPLWAQGDPRPYDPTSALAEFTGEKLAEEPARNTVFIVHGHDHSVLYQAARVVDKATDLEAVILMEQANQGQTVIEKFERHAAEAAYAVCLVTADDMGHARAGTPRPRGRQNVIFELGYFMGILGRDRVAVLLADGVEEPSDVQGLCYINLDSTGAWKSALAKEFVAAGIEVDYRKLP